MRTLHPALLLPLLLAVGACASMPEDPGFDIPAGAAEHTRTESNGDQITEYRVDGQVRVIRVQPPRGPAYYLYERNGAIVSTRPGDDPPQTYFKLFSW